MATTQDDFDEVSGSAWAEFKKKGDSFQGMFIEHFDKEARGKYGPQIVAVLETSAGTINVGLPAANSRYLGAIRKLTPGHDVKISLEGYYNQDTEQLMDVPGKTKKGTNWAKNYSIKQSRTPNPNFMSNMTEPSISIDDTPF
jgi:hypothetical protein